MPEILLALDLATQIGFALRERGGAIRSGSFRLPDSGNDVGWFLDEYDRWLEDMVTQCGVEIIAFEAPFIGENTHPRTAYKLMNLGGHTEFRARRLGLPSRFVREVNVGDVRRHFIGTNNGRRDRLKELTVAECRARGFDPENDDEADALAVLDYAAHCLCLPGLQAGALFKRAS